MSGLKKVTFVCIISYENTVSMIISLAYNTASVG